MPKNTVFSKWEYIIQALWSIIWWWQRVHVVCLFLLLNERLYDTFVLLNFEYTSIMLSDVICIEIYFLINISVMGCCVTTSQGRKTESSVLQERKVNIERRSSLNLAHKKHYVTFYCQVCNRPFNQISRFPYTICVNTHIACSHCGNSFYNNKVKNCPFCS